VIAHIWEEFLNIVRQEAGSRVVETWFRAVQFVQWRAEEQTAYLLAPNQFVRNWLISNYTKLIQVHLSRLLHTETVKIYISVEAKEEGAQLPKVQPVASVAKIEKERVAALVPQQNKQIGYLNRQYTFENFVVGPNNSLAYAAAQAVADHPGAVYNPLYIYGQSGLGKTHLMHAIGNAIKEKRSQAVVHYQTADRFVNEFISSIRFDKVHKFKQKYQNIDVLLIDDVQFIANKDQTQEAFFHIFNTLYESHKQIILSSDMVPQSLQGIAERLRSRMSWGLITDIHAPKLETKIAILKRKAHMHAEVLPDDVATYIAQSVDHNIRELEGALVRVIAFGALTQQPVTLAVAQKVLQRTRPEKRIIDFDSIIEVMKKHFSCKPALLQAKTRNKDIVHMRQVAMFLMKKYTDKSLRGNWSMPWWKGSFYRDACVCKN
jgi:chromosomal replication initiator protein